MLTLLSSGQQFVARMSEAISDHSHTAPDIASLIRAARAELHLLARKLTKSKETGNSP
jgi:hypothetical protein